MDEIAELDPELPIESALTMESVLARARTPWRFSMFFFGTFACLALTLASIGLWVSITYNVAQRRKEIGLRMALGASRQRVIELVARQGLSLTAAGLGLGLKSCLK